MAKINTHIAAIKDVDFPSTHTAVISFTNPESESVDVLMYSDEWGRYLKEYFSWKFIALGDAPANGVELYTTFMDVWNSFFMNRFSNYQVVYTAIMKEYDPLSNYDKTSKITTDVGAQTDKSVMAHYEDKTKNPLVQSSAEDQVSPYDSASYTNRNKTSSRVEAHDITIDHGAHTDELQKGARKDEVNEHTYGNIGTVTNYDMWSAEKDGRRFNFLKEIFEDFAKECLFLIDVV